MILIQGFPATTIPAESDNSGNENSSQHAPSNAVEDPVEPETPQDAHTETPESETVEQSSNPPELLE